MQNNEKINHKKKSRLLNNESKKIVQFLFVFGYFKCINVHLIETTTTISNFLIAFNSKPRSVFGSNLLYILVES